MIENITIIVIALFFILAALFFFFGSFYILLESAYGSFFCKPFYVHFYLSPKKLSANQVNILSQKFDFYKRLTPKHKNYFEHRVAAFIEKYPFHGNENLTVTDEMKVLIAATSTMLTFGMRKFTYTVFDKIILYPNEYYSQASDAYHKGEFNPRVKALVFSWHHFAEGYEISNDNLNLGLHEFSHTLHFESLRSTDISSVIYRSNFEKLSKEVNHPPNRERLMQSSYFRDYAYSNQFEFVAVILENFFETPEEFKRHFPELYQNVKRMINYKEL